MTEAPAPRQKCRQTGCNRLATDDAGVCQAHLHSSKCLCGNCPQHQPDRPGTRKVMVNTGNPGSSWGAPITATVTLPAMPWGDE